MTWVQENWVGILGVLGGLHAIAKIVVTWTPTETDNKLLASVERIFRVVGLQPKSKNG